MAKNVSGDIHIYPKGRDEIVLGVIESLYDATPSFVFRRDISAFYENVDHDNILEEICVSPRTHPQTRKLIRRLIDEKTYEAGKLGIPRGLGFSTLLSEIALSKFDKAIRSLPTVYRYFRFSDDILVFSTSKHGLADQIKSFLPPPMHFNTKSKDRDIQSLPHTIKKPCEEADLPRVISSTLN